MVHLEILFYGSPDKHEEFIRRINSWRYPVEGKEFKGSTAPVVSEIKAYDVRIPKEVAPRFLRDLNISNGKSEKESSSYFGNKFITKAIGWVRRLTGLKTIDAAEGEKEFKLDPWYYTYLIGTMEDPQGDEPNNEKREVL